MITYNVYLCINLKKKGRRFRSWLTLLQETSDRLVCRLLATISTELCESPF